MDEVARLPAADLADLFRAAAARRGLPDAIVEKDFWVCWTLKRIFTLANPPAGILFKGGTSLSKVYGVIDRFSEDVDLSFDRAGLGFGGADDPMVAASGKKQTSAVERLAEACTIAVREKLRPQLAEAFAAALGTASSWSLESATDDADDATLLFRYPSARLQSAAYITPFVRLELGARADHWPAKPGVVTPIAAEVFPQRFAAAACTVNTLAAERTFWEKATLLHKWFHAKPERRFPDRQSRHYYDLYRLVKSPVAESALADLSLLASVAAHKQVFFAQAWARYDLATPGTLRLVPADARLKELESDYRAMGQMIFGVPPAFGELMETLAALERTVNAMRPPRGSRRGSALGGPLG
jgi:hypothetical protein